jgi:NADPH:quinone reductase-like Zn-dependent oxidoreductase
MMLSPLVRQKLGILGAKESSADLAVLRELLETGKVTPAVDRTYPLSEAPAAIRYLRQGHARGKIVITM